MAGCYDRNVQSYAYNKRSGEAKKILEHSFKDNIVPVPISYYANYFGPVPVNLWGEDDMVCTCGCKDVTRGSQVFEDEILVLN